MAHVEEVVILTDADGEYYVVSKEVIQRGKLEGELKEAIITAAEADVSGFSFNFGSTQFQPLQVGDPAPPGSNPGFHFVGTFQYQQPPGVKISKTLLPGR